MKRKRSSLFPLAFHSSEAASRAEGRVKRKKIGSFPYSLVPPAKQPAELREKREVRRKVERKRIFPLPLALVPCHSSKAEEAEEKKMRRVVS